MQGRHREQTRRSAEPAGEQAITRRLSLGHLLWLLLALVMLASFALLLLAT